MLHEAGMLGEIGRLTVFEDEESILLEHALGQDNVRQLVQLCQCIGGVCKDEVELFTAFAQETEDVCPDGNGIQVLQLVNETADKVVVQGIHFDGNNSAASTAE